MTQTISNMKTGHIYSNLYRHTSNLKDSAGTERVHSFSENAFPPENGLIEKLMIPSESAPQELSNEWSYQQVWTILKVLGQFLCLVTISP
jgi:hypothetical protein